MNAPLEWRPAPLRAPGANGSRFALALARNVHALLDRRMPEAAALATWLAQGATAFGLDDDALPEADDTPKRPAAGVPLEDWRRVGAAIDAAAAAHAGAPPGTPDHWLAAIGDALGLDPLARRILALALHYRLDLRVERLFDALCECRGAPERLHRDPGLFALLLGAPVPEIAAALASDAALIGSGMLMLDERGFLSVLDRLVVLIRQDIPPAPDFYDQLLGAGAADPLPWDAFAHLGPEAEVAAAVLRAALEAREKGIGILLYGAPGAGKTSFAATLAARVGARLRPVAEASFDGDEPERHDRLAGLRLAQRLATPGDTLLLFDEAEDLFARRSTAFDEVVSSSRVYTHRLLERLTIPVIWTANDIRVLGPAILRRMTMCIEMKVPDLAARTRLWRRMAETEGVDLPDAQAARLARLVPAAPAVASTALRATRLAGGGADTARLIVEGIARAVRGGALAAPEATPTDGYDPALVNADADLGALAARLVRPGAPRAVSFLLSGPPGAGKSAWVRHLAGCMGLTVLQKRASDLLDAYVGGTEQRIAEAFTEARDAGAFLVFDEADSLLLERGDAVRSWEISQVNEMLTWMESHPLPFACTTNLVDRLDRASLRRFLVKLRFDWLTAAQARLAFRQFFAATPPPALDALRTLTPADFALVRRRAELEGGLDAAALLRLLAAECDGRVGGRANLGFLGGG